MSNRTRIALLLLAALLAPDLLAQAELKNSSASAIAETTQQRGKIYALFMRALMAQRRGEYRIAASEVRKAIEIEPDSPAVLIQGAELLEMMGRLRDAEDLARKALSIAPDDVAALGFVADRAAARALGTSKPDVKSREEALRLYGRMMGLGVEDPELLRKVVSLRLQAGDERGALEVAEQLVEKRPGDRHAVGMLAQLLMDSGQARRALRVLVRFIIEHPNDSPLIRLAEELAQDLDAWDVVEETFAGAAGFEERAVEAQRLRGKALLRLDRVGAASQALEKVLLTDPTDQDVRFDLARIYRRMGRLGDAAVLARGLAEKAPADRGTVLLLAEILDDQADVDGALTHYDTVVQLFSEDDEPDEGARQLREAVRRRMVLLYLASDRNSAARDLLTQMELPESSETLEISARIAVAEKDWSQTRAIARKLRSVGEVAVAAMLEAEVSLSTDRPARAEARIAEAVQEVGHAARVRGAALYLGADRLEDGAALLRAWVEQEPDNSAARFQLGSYLYQANQLESAEQEMREVFRIDPHHAQALNFLGYSYAERGIQLDEALELVQRALTIDPWNGAYLDSLGWVYYRMERYSAAKDPLERAARTYPHDPTVLEHLGDVYVKVGERDLAVAAWSRALDAGPEDPATLRAKIEVVEVAEQESPGSGQTAKPALLPELLDPSAWP